MGMNVGSGSGSGEPEVMMDVNTTPLIDVMLVLLVMLIITIPIQFHSVKLDFPVGPPPPQTVEPEKHIVDIDFDGTVLVDNVAVDQAGLEAKFAQYASNPDASKQPNVMLRPNAQANYDVVARVLSSASRLGVSKIGLIGDEQFM
jgi:biopolymer transport protein ExbD